MLETAQTHWESGGFSGKPSVFLHPNAMIPRLPRHYIRFSAVDPVTYFIYHPWFEPIQSRYNQRGQGKFTITKKHLRGRYSHNTASLEATGNTTGHQGKLRRPLVRTELHPGSPLQGG